MENQPAKVLIFDTAWLGDVIFTTSLIGAVKAVWPRTELHVLVAGRGELLLKDSPRVDRLWVYDKSGDDKSLASMGKVIISLRNEKFDVVLNAHPSFRSRLITWRTRAPIRIGYRGFGAALANTHSISNSLDIQPDHARRRVNLLREIMPNAEGAKLEVGVSEQNRKLAAQQISRINPHGRELLGIVPGSARRTKMWSALHFSELVKRWCEERDGMALVFGANAERGIVETICAAAGERAVPIIQQPLDLVAAMLSACNCVVGNDTGVSFLAIAAGCPKVVVLYGCTQVNYSFPEPHRAIYAGVPCCLPRTGHGRALCKWGDEPWCMAQINVERVWEELSAAPLRT